ncbi:MAG: GNAT family N-acetyltransferase [Gammaproteobacteria bacterium]|nr:GNAT family N-acetyltransferase [Gammaproteobacteria bacterium]
MSPRLDKLPQIETPRLLLREVNSDDAQALFDIYSREDVVRYWDHPAWTQKSQADELIKSALDGFAAYEMFAWCVTLRESGAVIGTCCLFDYSEEHRTAEIGYAFHPDHWGQRYALELMPPLIAFGFDSLDLNRIHAAADPRNLASLKILLSHGFKQEGLLRHNWIYRDEKPSDTALLGLLRHEWKTGSARETR